MKLNRFTSGMLALHSIALIALLSLQAYSFFTPKSTQYIRVNEVYESFQLTQELKQELNTIENLRNSMLDSLELNLKVQAQSLSTVDKPAEQDIIAFRKSKDDFLRKKQEFEETNEVLLQQYNERISKQINQYIKDFGEQHNYEYIHGADGSGSLMYADNSRDVTDEAIAFINNRYQGK